MKMRNIKRIITLCVMILMAAVCILLAPHSAQAASEGGFTYEVHDGKATITGGGGHYLTIPETIAGYPVVAIGEGAFENSDLCTVTIPEGVTSIGESAFYRCYRLYSVSMPDSVTSVGDYAFYGCDDLDNVTISRGLKSIGNYVFFGCSNLTRIYIPESVESIGKCAFSLTGLLDLTIPDSVTSIDNSAFSGCNRLKSVTIPGGIEKVGKHMFSQCSNLTDVVIEEGITSIEEGAFSECTGLTCVTIPACVSYIDYYAFDDCKSVTFRVHKDNAYAIRIAESRSIPYITGPYTVIFQNADGSVHSNNEYYTGDEIVIPENPIKPADADYGYIFAGWEPEVKPCAGDAVYTAVYTAKKIIKEAPQKPTVRYVSVKRVELEEVPGCEYSLDGVSWQDSAVFTGLMANRQYTFYQRIKETDKSFASPASAGLTVKTLKTYPKDFLVSFNTVPVYTGDTVKIKPIVSMGSEILEEGQDYSLSYENNVNAGDGAVVIVKVTGDGSKKVYRKTFTIMPADLALADISVDACEFSGSQKEPAPAVTLNGVTLVKGTDYVVQYRNNTNIGTATARIIGTGNYTGYVDRNFKITAATKSVTLYGKSYPSYYESTITMAPGTFKGVFNSSLRCIGDFILKDVSTGLTVKTEHYISLQYPSINCFTYTFPATNDEQVYSLAYSWTDYAGNAYSGILTIVIYAGSEQPSGIEIEQAEDNSLCYDYLSVKSAWYADEGVVKWSVSDVSVASVEDGLVYWKKPGTIVITAKAAGLTATKTLTITQQDISLSELKMTDTGSQSVAVLYKEQRLEEGVDYTMSRKTTDAYVEITVQGCGLFSGVVSRRFSLDSGSQYYDGYVISFVYEDGAPILQKTYHYGDIVEVPAEPAVPDSLSSAYIFAGWDKEISVCTADAVYVATFKLRTLSGDLDGNDRVDEDDAIYLLRHVLMPGSYPVNQPVDYNNSSSVDEDDAIYLLRHVLMPGQFPI